MSARIRSAVPADAQALLDIYSFYVEHTAVSFECRVPTREEFAHRIARTLEAYPYLVLEEDGTIQGYAYAGPFGKREAYRFSCEVSIYLAPDSRRKGGGRRLYAALEQALRAQGIRNLYACIADPVEEDEYLDRSSEAFHTRLGYTTVGRFHRCGFKFGRWYHMIWMEKLLEEQE